MEGKPLRVCKVMLGLLASLHTSLYSAVWWIQQVKLDHKMGLLVDALEACSPKTWASSQRKMRKYEFLHYFRGRL